MRSTGLVPELPRRAWFVLVGVTLSAVGSGLTLPFFVVYLNRVRGLELVLSALSLSVLAVAGLVGNPVAGALTDRIGSRRVLILGAVGSTLGTAWLAFVTSPWQAFGAAAVLGFGNAVTWPALDALLASVVPVARRSSAFSVRHATINLGFGVGAVGAAVIADFASVRSFQVLYLLDAATFLAFVPILLLLRGVGDPVDVELGEAKPVRVYNTILRDPAFRWIWLLGALIVFAGYGQFSAAFAPYATRTGGIGSHALAIAFAANTFGVAALQLVVLRLMVGRRRTSGVALVYLCWAATWTIAIAAAHVGGGAAAVVGFALAATMFAVGETLLSPTLSPMLNDLAPERLRGRYNGFYTLGWTVGFIAAPAAAGVGLGVGDGTAFFVALVGACLLGAAGAFRLRRHVPPAADRVGDTHGDAAAAEPELA
jgi:MFS family permease